MCNVSETIIFKIVLIFFVFLMINTYLIEEVVQYTRKKKTSNFFVNQETARSTFNYEINYPCQ